MTSLAVHRRYPFAEQICSACANVLLCWHPYLDSIESMRPPDLVQQRTEAVSVFLRLCEEPELSPMWTLACLFKDSSCVALHVQWCLFTPSLWQMPPKPGEQPPLFTLHGCGVGAGVGNGVGNGVGDGVGESVVERHCVQSLLAH